MLVALSFCSFPTRRSLVKAAWLKKISKVKIDICITCFCVCEVVIKKEYAFISSLRKRVRRISFKVSPIIHRPNASVFNVVISPEPLLWRHGVPFIAATSQKTLVTQTITSLKAMPVGFSVNVLPGGTLKTCVKFLLLICS